MKCKNCEGKYYTGKENTPLGRGFSASAEKIGKRMKGKDGKMYEVVKSGKGKRWARVTSTKKTDPSSKRKTSPRMDDRKLWEYMENIQITTTEYGIVKGIKYEKGDILPNGDEVNEVYDYNDHICDVSAWVTDVVSNSPDSVDRLIFEWKDGKSPKDNKQCRESRKVIRHLVNYFDKEATDTETRRYVNVLYTINTYYGTGWYNVGSHREDIGGLMNPDVFDSYTDEDL